MQATGVLLAASALLLVAAAPTSLAGPDPGPARFAMVWPVPDRSTEFDPFMVTEVLATYPDAFAVLATRDQLRELRQNGFDVDEHANDALFLPSGAIDPVAEEERPEADGERPYIVQFVASPTEEWIDLLLAHGARIPSDPYVPINGVLALLTRDEARQVRLEEVVRSVTALILDDKLASDLPENGEARVSITLFDPSRIERVAALVKDLDGRILGPTELENSTYLLAALAARHIEIIAKDRAVRWIGVYIEPTLANDVARDYAGVTDARTLLLLTGAGETVAVADTGLDTGLVSPNNHPDLNEAITDHFGYGRPSIGPDPLQNKVWSDPHGHGTHVAGSVLGDGNASSGDILGMAPDADLVFQSIMDGFGNLIALNVGLDQVFGDAYDAGARIHSNSWGSSCGFFVPVSCPYDSTTRTVDDFVFDHPDFLVLFAAGNNGYDFDSNGVIDDNSLGSPAISKNALTVGASENFRSEGLYPDDDDRNLMGFPDPLGDDGFSDDPNGLAYFSSRGPTADGRIKPDVVAPGTNILSTRSAVADPDNFWALHANTEYAFMGGTSMATPVVAGAAALLRQQYSLMSIEPSAALMKASIIHSATDLAPGQFGPDETQEIGGAPDYAQGWGRVDIDDSAGIPLNWDFYDHEAGIGTGEVWESRLVLNDVDNPISVTLVWSDPAASPGCSLCLVNNLDLVLIGPDGATYRGNKFTTAINSNDEGRISQKNPSGGDTRNNVERVEFPTGMPAGLYRLRVVGQSVPTSSSGVDQPFAVVWSGGLGTKMDLEVTQTADDTTVEVGDENVFNIDVTNHGPATASDIFVHSRLPTGFEVDDILDDGATCTQTGQLVQCSLDPILADGTHTINILGIHGALGTNTNVASASHFGGGVDINPFNNIASQSVAVAATTADLSLALTESADPSYTANRLTYTYTASNSGPDTAHTVQLKGTLPTGVPLGAPDPSQGSCTQALNVINCALGPIASGEAATVEVDVIPAKATTLAASGSLTSSTSTDPDSIDRSATQSTVIQAFPTNLVVSTLAPGGPYWTGRGHQFETTVTNAGAFTTPNVILKSTFTSGVAFGSINTDQGSCTRASNVVTCSLGTINSGEDVLVQITVSSLKPMTITDTAVASTTHLSVDAAPLDNKDVASIVVVAPRSDLAVAKTSSLDTIQAGQEVEFTVTVTNNGPDSSEVKLVDTMPAGVELEDIVPSQGDCTVAGSIITCLLENIDSLANATLVYLATPAKAGPFLNTAVASLVGGGIDPDTSDNKATKTVNVLANGNDLSVTQSDNADPVGVGLSLTYTALVTNNGPEDAVGATFKATLPTSVLFGTITPDQGSCTRASNVVTCNLGFLANGENAEISMTVFPKTTGTIRSVVTATPVAGVDPTPATHTEPTVVTAASTDMAVLFSPDPTTQRVGVPFNYEIKVDNNGPDFAPNPLVTITLPSSFTIGTMSPAQGSCTKSSNVVKCSLGVMASGDEVNIDLTVTPRSAGSALVAKATVASAPATDPVSSNNAHSISMAVTLPQVNLVVSQVDGGPDPLAGFEYGYALDVRNDGSELAPAATLKHTLTGGTNVYTTITPTQGTCARSSNVITCTLGAIDAGNNATVAVNIVPMSGGVRTSVTSATAPGSTDTEPSSNSNTITTTVVTPSIDLSVEGNYVPHPVAPQTPFDFFLLVNNNGPDHAGGVTFTFTIPAGFVLLAVDPLVGVCSTTSTKVTCALGQLLASESTSVLISLRAANTGTYLFTAAASASVAGSDPITSNNSFTFSVPVQ